MNHEAQSPPPRNRKQYDTPRVAVYGNIREITRATGNMGATDGGSSNTMNSA